MGRDVLWLQSAWATIVNWIVYRPLYFLTTPLNLCFMYTATTFNSVLSHLPLLGPCFQPLQSSSLWKYLREVPSCESIYELSWYSFSLQVCIKGCQLLSSKVLIKTLQVLPSSVWSFTLCDKRQRCRTENVRVSNSSTRELARVETVADVTHQSQVIISHIWKRINLRGGISSFCSQECFLRWEVQQA